MHFPARKQASLITVYKYQVNSPYIGFVTPPLVLMLCLGFQHLRPIVF